MRKFLETKAGQAVGVIGAGLCLALGAYVIFSSLGASAASVANDRVFIDATTGNTFEYQLRMGDAIPVDAPSGQKTGFPAEACYWTKEGTATSEPHFVLLNDYANKPGPTFCPTCSRLVVGHNPVPVEGSKAPPTQAEYKPRR